MEIALFPLPMMCFGQIVGLMQQSPAAADDATAAWRAVTEAPGHVEIGLFPLPTMCFGQIVGLMQQRPAAADDATAA